MRRDQTVFSSCVFVHMYDDSVYMGVSLPVCMWMLALVCMCVFVCVRKTGGGVD